MYRGREVGRPPYEPDEATRDKVKMLAILGHTQLKIAEIIGVNERTMRRYYRNELDHGIANTNAGILSNLIRIAMGNTVAAGPAAMFLLKTRAGFRETDKQAADANDKPPAIHVHFPEKKE